MWTPAVAVSTLRPGFPKMDTTLDESHTIFVYFTWKIHPHQFRATCTTTWNLLPSFG